MPTLQKKETRLALQQANIDNLIAQGATLETYLDVKLVTYEKEIKGTIRPCLKAWIGASSKPCDNAYYFLEAHRTNRMTDLKACADHRAKQAQERKDKKANLINPYKVGDIFHGSWGYDQTNCEYVQAVKVGAKSLVVRAIGAKSVEGTQGFMCQNLVPDKDRFIGPETTVILRPGWEQNGLPRFTFAKHASMSLWDGTPKYSSW